MSEQKKEFKIAISEFRDLVNGEPNGNLEMENDWEIVELDNCTKMIAETKLTIYGQMIDEHFVEQLYEEIDFPENCILSLTKITDKSYLEKLHYWDSKWEVQIAIGLPESESTEKEENIEKPNYLISVFDAHGRGGAETIADNEADNVAELKLIVCEFINKYMTPDEDGMIGYYINIIDTNNL